MANPEWRFPSNDDGEIKGINDTGVTTFKGDPLKSLAREICQNSLDAARDGKAEVDFSLFTIPQENVPGINSLKYAFKRCYEFSNIKESRDFFFNALEKADETMCTILRVSDHLTTGLTGAKEKMNTNWTNLIKSSGVSDKKGAAGGSFGIGKYAPFACSVYSSVFYSTYNIDNESAYQGVARLASFVENEEKTTQGIGYFGNEKNSPVYEQLKLDENFHRGLNDYGTDIYIIAFKFADYDWQTELIITLLDNFLEAIWSGKLSVKIDNITVNNKTLRKLIYDNYREELSKRYIDKYYEVLTSKETIWKVEKDFFAYGEIRLGILVSKNELPRKISMVRKTGMKIMDKQFRSHVQYIGICIIIGDKINARLRAMENPEHNKWEPNRLTDPKKGRALKKALEEFIHEEISKLSVTGLDSAVDAAGVGAYIPDEADEDSDNGKNESLADSIADIERVIQKPIKITRKNRYDGECDKGFHNVYGEDSTGIVHNDGKVNNPDPKNRKPSSRMPGGDETGEQQIPVKLKKIRPLCIDYKLGSYVFVLESEQDVEDAIIEIVLSAESDNYPASISQAVMIPNTKLTIEGNRVKNIVLHEGESTRIKIDLDYHDYCSLEVSCYEIKK